MPSIEVTIKIDHYDGVIEVHRDSALHAGGLSTSPSAALKSIVACAEASALAAMWARPER